MNLQKNIRRVLREEYIPTETEYLGWDIPRKLYDELEDIGIKRWDKENDKVYIAEFQFDTKSVVFEILDSYYIIIFYFYDISCKFHQNNFLECAPPINCNMCHIPYQQLTDHNYHPHHLQYNQYYQYNPTINHLLLHRKFHQ